MCTGVRIYFHGHIYTHVYTSVCTHVYTHVHCITNIRMPIHMLMYMFIHMPVPLSHGSTPMSIGDVCAIVSYTGTIKPSSDRPMSAPPYACTHPLTHARTHARTGRLCLRAHCHRQSRWHRRHRPHRHAQYGLVYRYVGRYAARTCFCARA